MTEAHNITVSIADKLKHFLPEIEYTFQQIGKYLGLNFLLSIENSQSFISYGHSSGQVVIAECFFTEMCDVDKSGIYVKKNIQLPLAKKHQWNENIFHALFETSDNQVIEEHSNSIKINFDLIGSVFFQLSRIEELNRLDLDRHQRFKMENTLAFKSGFLNHPEVNFQLELLRNIFKVQGLNASYLLPYSAHITHDVDRLKNYHSLWLLFRGALADIVKKRKPWKVALKDVLSDLTSGEPSKSFDYLMGLSEKYDQKSIFFFIADGRISHDADYQDRYRRSFLSMVKKIKIRGHKIGIHPGYNTYNNASELGRHYRKLSKLTKTNIKLCRQHVLRWEPQTVDLHESLGIEHDYTLAFPAGITFRSGSTFSYNAYSLTHRKSLNIRLYPTSIMEFAIFMDKYIKLSKLEAYKLIKENVGYYKRFGGDLVVLFHTVIVMDFKEEYEETLKIIFDS